MLRKLVFLFLLFLGTFTYSFAQTDTNDEGTLEVTIPSTNPDLGETATPHAPSSPLATGYYDVSTDQLFLYFVFVPDNSVVTVTSTAGDICIQAVDPLTATVSMQLSGNPGLYVISVTSSSGVSSSAEFVII